MQLRESMKLEGSSADVWMRASTIQDIPKYWHGTHSLDVAGNDGGVVRVKVKFAFGGSGEAAISLNEAERTLTIDYVSGPFTGKQIIAVGDDSITASWDVTFRGVYRIASKWNEGHFRSGTVHALERLVHGKQDQDGSSKGRPISASALGSFRESD